MKTILQVEDDANDVFFLQRAMKKAGVSNPIQVASDGREAIDYLQGAGKFADRGSFPFPCLVLLDLKIPYVMGLDVLKWIREQQGMLVPVVILSSSSEESDMKAAYGLGANGFLVKPSVSSELERMAEAIKQFWLTHNTLPSACKRAEHTIYSGATGQYRSSVPAPIAILPERWNPALSEQPAQTSLRAGL